MSEARPYYPDEMMCCACERLINRWDRQFAVVWTDPAGITCVAHRCCLAAMGEPLEGVL